MGTINGTIRGVRVEHTYAGGLGRRLALVTADFAAYASTDDATITGILTAIAARTRSGKTLTLRAAATGSPGRDTANQAVYVDTAITLSNTTTTGDLAFDLADVAGTEITASTATDTALGVWVVYDET